MYTRAVAESHNDNGKTLTVQIPGLTPSKPNKLISVYSRRAVGLRAVLGDTYSVVDFVAACLPRESSVVVGRVTFMVGFGTSLTGQFCVHFVESVTVTKEAFL